MLTSKDITIEQIKERIKTTLLEKKNKLSSEISDGNRGFVSTPSRSHRILKESIIKKFINYGLRHKKIIKKIPILGSISKKLYHSLLYGSLQNDNPQSSTQEKKNFKSTIKKIPVVGYLIWWIYMVLKAPLKIRELYSEVNGLKNRDEALESKIRELYSEVNGLKNRDEALESKIRELYSEVNGLKNRDEALESKIRELYSEVNGLKNRDEALESKISELYSEVNGLKNRDESYKRLGTDWAEFYSKEITKEDMEGNINHHRYFIDLIFDWANKRSDHHTLKLLEIGLGTATMSIYLSKRSFEVVGLDLDPLIVAKAIETNNKLGGHAKFIAMDAFDLPKFFKENTFDIAFSQGTMEHFDNDALKKILEAQLAVAKHVIFSVPSVNWPREDFGNERKMTVEEWEKLLKDFRLMVNHISYYQEGDLHIAVVVSNQEK